jgi:hypothetical protein
MTLTMGDSPLGVYHRRNLFPFYPTYRLDSVASSYCPLEQ